MRPQSSPGEWLELSVKAFCFGALAVMLVIVLPTLPFDPREHPSHWLYIAYAVGPYPALAVVAWYARVRRSPRATAMAAGVAALVMAPTLVLWCLWTYRVTGASNGMVEFGTPLLHWLADAFAALTLLASEDRQA
jgi:hypothetical protein